jgi:hypothetical protein
MVEIKRSASGDALLGEFDIRTHAARLRVTSNLLDEQVRVSLDHTIENASDPTQALEVSNFRLGVPRREQHTRDRPDASSRDQTPP